ncbi:thiamine phosphate synthase [Niallia circulans]
MSSITGIKRDLTIPLYAIGGINEERVGQLASLGVDGVAIMSAIFSASQPLRAVQRIRERCEECGNQKI